MINDSDYVVTRRHSPSAPTVIAFSSVNTPAGRFKPYKIFDGVEANIVFVNTVDNDWYLNGVPTIADGAHACAQALIAHARSLSHAPVVTFGTSMGAAGAALYAALGHADACLAFGIEVELCVPGSRSATHIKFPERLPLRSLSQPLQDCAHPTYIYAAENDDWDLMGAWHLRGCTQVIPVAIRGVEHPGLQVFTLDRSMSTMLGEFTRHGRPPLGFPRQGTLFTSWALIEGLLEAGQRRRDGDIAGWLATLEPLARCFPGQPAVWQRLGDAYQANRRGPESERCWRTAIALCPFQYEAHGKLTNLLRKRGQLSEALEHAERALAIFPRNGHVRHNLGLALLASGAVKRAREQLLVATHIAPGNKVFRESLSQAEARGGV